MGARSRDGGRQSARRRCARAAAAGGPRLGAGGRGADPGARHDAAVVAAPAARGGRAGRPRVDAARGGELAREPDGESGAGRARVARRDRGRRPRDRAGRARRRAARRPPPGESGREGTLPFQATERAQAVAREQAALQQRVEQLSRAVEEIARAARAAGIDDTAFQARLREVQELLQRAVTPQLEQRLRELQDALAKLDPEAARQALERLAEAQQQLKAELERSRELFRRAAVEGALASLAADAEDLKRRQGEWNRDDAARPDSAAAARQRALAERADSLAAGIDQGAKDPGAPPPSPAPPAPAPRHARAAMQRAARAADGRPAGEAQQAGQQAQRQLEDAPDQL